MADRRKLQGEIDKCLKKISEGVESFEDTWKKLQVSNNTNQKDKYESDLKKEIKKLQRLRDQIKTWLTSSDIKDKKSLQDSKRLIETQMERFKVVEKETKIKAYSKEGLGAAQKVDPVQKERDETSSWLTACVEKLNIELDIFESELEIINVGMKKKKIDKEKTKRHEKLKDSQSKHQYHITQLETLLRMLDNGTVEVEQIKQIQEDVDHYCDNSQDPDFQGNDYMYVDLNLDSLDDYLAKQTMAVQAPPSDVKNGTTESENSTALSNSSTASNSRSQTPFLETSSSEESKPSALNSVQSPPASSTVKSSSISSASLQSTEKAVPHPTVQNEQSVINSQTPLYAAAVAGMPNSSVKTPSNHESPWTPPTNCLDPPSESDSKHFQSSNSPVQNHTNHISSSPSSTVNPPVMPESSAMPGFSLPDPPSQPESGFVGSSRLLGESGKQMMSSALCQSEEPRPFAGASAMPPVIPNDAQLSLESLSERSLLNSRLCVKNNAHNLSLSEIQNSGGFGPTPGPVFSPEDLFSFPPSSASIDISQVFGSFPEPMGEQHRRTLAVLDAMHKHMPIPWDSQKRRFYRPGGPALTPDYYPTNTPKGSTIDFFKQLSNETLFFIFYYFEGTKAQYFAAKALKTKSWRFHTMFMMWFQRHEQPNNVTDEFEQGTYVYFDYEKWREEKKEGFTFEYKYLEDKDLSEN